MFGNHILCSFLKILDLQLISIGIRRNDFTHSKSLMMFILLSLGSGIFWSITYILIIRRGFQDKTYGMPFAALCLNISWEFIFSFILPHRSIQRAIDIVWFLLDAVIVTQFLKYGPDQFPRLSKLAFYTAFVLTLITSFCTVLFASIEFHDRQGAYAAFGQNLLMSMLFITMLYQRQSLRGQSVGIAVCKLVGTVFASISFYLYADISRNSIFLPFCYIAIFVYDLIYVGLLVAQQSLGVARDRTEAQSL